MSGLRRLVFAMSVWALSTAWVYSAEEPENPPQAGVADAHGNDRMVLGGLKYDSIMGPTAALCVCWHIDHPAQLICSHDFWILQAEAGEGGGKLQFGYGAWYMAGGTIKASVLQTWGDPMEVGPEQTYLGAELQLNLFMINGAVGLYTRVHGDDDETLVTWSAGIGF